MTNVPINILRKILHSVTYDHQGIAHSSLPSGSVAFTRNYMKSEALPFEPGTIIGILYVCPCGCQGIGAIPFYKYDKLDAWNWNGSQHKPTLTPSILRKKTCGWHGYLTDGVFTS